MLKQVAAGFSLQKNPFICLNGLKRSPKAAATDKIADAFHYATVNRLREKSPWGVC
jgi:hypothetical protein